MTTDNYISDRDGIDVTLPIVPGHGTILSEGAAWTAEGREQAVRAAAAELSVIYETLPRDGKDHPVRVYDDTVSLVYDQDRYGERQDPSWRANEHKFGSICHHESSSVIVNGLLGRGLVVCFDHKRSNKDERYSEHG